MTDLIAFVSARLDEDEATARACADHDGYLEWLDSRAQASGDHTIRTRPGSRVIARIRRDDVEGNFGRLLDPDAVAAFIACHDPAVTLREVEAKRAILNAYACTDGNSPRDRDRGRWDALCAAVRYLAAVYSDHPDYRQEWEGLTDG